MLHVKTLKMDEPLSQYFAFITFIILYIGVNILYDCLNCFARVDIFYFRRRSNLFKLLLSQWLDSKEYITRTGICNCLVGHSATSIFFFDK
jgi:hypothetical protein